MELLLPGSYIAALGLKNAIDIHKDLSVLDQISTAENQESTQEAIVQNAATIYGIANSL